jgi:hypothetical protein
MLGSPSAMIPIAAGNTQSGNPSTMIADLVTRATATKPATYQISAPPQRSRQRRVDAGKRALYSDRDIFENSNDIARRLWPSTDVFLQTLHHQVREGRRHIRAQRADRLRCFPHVSGDHTLR